MFFQYAYINGVFVPLAKHVLSFAQAELFARRLLFAVPIIQTFPLQTDETAKLAQQCAEVHYQQSISLNGAVLRALIAELISRNRYFQDAVAEISVHPELDGREVVQLSISLRASGRFSALKNGLTCKVVRSIFMPPAPQTVQLPPSASRSATLYLQPSGCIQSSSCGSIAVIKGDRYLVPSSASLDIASPVARLSASIAQCCGMHIVSANISEHDLLDADEVLLPSATGILEWCAAYQNRRYFARKFKLIANAIIQTAGSTEH